MKKDVLADSLLREAVTAMACAHAPYSKYRVGAALLTADGTVFRGCNVENASYGLTICAERVAVCSAIAAGHNSFKALAIVAGGNIPPSPCGACRQTLAEFCTSGFPVYYATSNNLHSYKRLILGQLLPAAFKL